MDQMLSQEEALFHAALEIDATDQRNAYLDSACGHQKELRRRVEALLRRHAEPQGPLDRPTVGLSAPTDHFGAEKPGTILGRYKLLELIGEGGMGSVWLAEQREALLRLVALKVIKAGMDSKQVIARFEAERQALALMDHPNIAHVLDADTTACGRPYFVMELVRGSAITCYCDNHRLTLNERLGLFMQVCQAVQHAHQKGVIHRDLKPSNVLVALHDDKPVVKVIDFGVAKAMGERLTEQTLSTGIGAVVGTLQYMSPEQAELNNRDIDTRSDIYSLGVLLYELLTGTTPLSRQQVEQSALLELLRLIREDEPARPSIRLSESGKALRVIAAQRHMEPARLTKELCGELDWIVMKCLEKDRNRRYQTASGLARDVERYLNNESVEACPPSAGYRLRKFLSKHRAGVLAAAAFVGLLLTAVVVSTWQTVRLDERRAEALRNWQYFESAEQERTEQLWQACLAQARAGRWSQRPGRRFDGLQALTRAAAIRPSLELRNEAIACLALADVRERRRWPVPPRTSGVGFDSPFERYARADRVGNISIRRLSDDRELTQLPGFGRRVYFSGSFAPLSFSLDGRYLAATYADHPPGKVEHVVWEVTSKRPVLRVPNGMLENIDFSPDSRRAAVGHRGGALVVYDLATGREVRRLSPGLLWFGIRFDPTGHRLAVSETTGSVQVWDLDTAKLLQKFSGLGRVFGIAWHPDGKSLAAAGDTRIFLLEVETGRIQGELKGFSGQATRVAFGFDDLLASSGWDGNAYLWDTRSGHKLLSVFGNGALQFRRDGRELAVLTPEEQPAGVGVLEVACGKEFLRSLPNPSGDPHLLIDFHPDGPLLAAASSKGVRLWDLAIGREIPFLSVGERHGFLFHPDGHSLLTIGPKRVQRRPLKLDLAAPGTRLTVGLPQDLGPSDGVPRHLAFSQDGQKLAAVHTQRRQVSVLDLKTGARKILTSDYSRVDNLTISPDGRWVAAGNWHGAGFKVWEVESGKLVADLPTPHHAVVLFSPDGKWLAVGAAGEGYVLREPGTWRIVRVLPCETDLYQAGKMAFSPDGRVLALISRRTEVKLIDLATGREFATLTPPRHGGLGFLRFGPNGSWLAATEDGGILVWNLRRVREQLAAMGLDWDQPPYPPVPEVGGAVSAPPERRFP